MKPEILIPIVVGVAALALGILAGILLRKKIGEAKIGSAEAEAKRILDEGVKNAMPRKRKRLLRQRKKRCACATKPNAS